MAYKSVTSCDLCDAIAPYGGHSVITITSDGESDSQISRKMLCTACLKPVADLAAALKCRPAKEAEKRLELAVGAWLAGGSVAPTVAAPTASVLVKQRVWEFSVHASGMESLRQNISANNDSYTEEQCVLYDLETERAEARQHVVLTARFLIAEDPKWRAGRKLKITISEEDT